MRKLLKILGILSSILFGMLLLGLTLFAVEVLSREPPRAVASTQHTSIPRTACIECHAPIAAEWRQSYHRKSVTGPYWAEVRELGYLGFFDALRKPCLNCHAPANVLDLARATAVGGGAGLGVECTPNIFREPEGIIPAARFDEVELGVDCTACHVAERGVVGSGRLPTAAHESLADPRFQDAALASSTLCGTCHRATVEAWMTTRFRVQGVTCLDCHMPLVRAAAVADGPPRTRRSHRFAADKDDGTLMAAVHATLEITADRQARLRITNDRVGHYFPSGANWLSVRFSARDGSGRILAEHKTAFGREEALILDFWPFSVDERIPSGAQRQILFPLPAGSGTVEAVVNYHDWAKVKRTVLTLTEDY